MARKKNKLGPIRAPIRGIVEQIPIIGKPLASVMLATGAKRSKRVKKQASMQVSNAAQAVYNQDVAAARQSMASVTYTGSGYPTRYKQPVTRLDGKKRQPDRVSSVNARCYIEQLNDPFGIQGMRMPSPDDFGTCVFTTYQKFDLTDVTGTGTTANHYQGFVWRPYLGAGTGLLTAIASGVETWAMSDLPTFSTASTLFSHTRCVGGGLRAYSKIGVGNATTQPQMFVMQWPLFENNDSLTNLNLLSYMKTAPGVRTFNAVDTGFDPIEAVWNPLTVTGTPTIAESSTQSLGAAAGTTWIEFSANSGSTLPETFDNAIVVMMDAGSSSLSNNMAIEAFWIFEGIPNRSYSNYLCPEVCYGSGKELTDALYERPITELRRVRSRAPTVQGLSQLVEPYSLFGQSSAGFRLGRVTLSCKDARCADVGKCICSCGCKEEKEREKRYIVVDELEYDDLKSKIK